MENRANKNLLLYKNRIDFFFIRYMLLHSTLAEQNRLIQHFHTSALSRFLSFLFFEMLLNTNGSQIWIYFTSSSSELVWRLSESAFFFFQFISMICEVFKRENGSRDKPNVWKVIDKQRNMKININTSLIVHSYFESYMGLTLFRSGIQKHNVAHTI